MPQGAFGGPAFPPTCATALKRKSYFLRTYVGSDSSRFIAVFHGSLNSLLVTAGHKKKDKEDKKEDSDGKQGDVDPEELGRAAQRTVETWEALRN